MHDKKRLYVMFVAACCAVSAAWAKPVSEAGLKIMSFNVRHCEGMDGRIDVARTAARIRLNSPENIVARYPNSFGGEDVRKLDAHEQVHLPGVRPLFGTGSLPCGYDVRSHSTRLSRIRLATARKMQCELSSLTFCKK